MKIHNVVQGSPEWHALRAQHFCASEAPAMMGDSPYQSRGDLLRQKKLGITADADAAQQRRFDDGHAAEAAFRPQAEVILGAELYPVVGTVQLAIDLPLLASFDGLTMSRRQGYEHKLFNQATADYIAQHGEPPQQHVWQLEHQLLVSDADEILFCTTDGIDGPHVIYTSKPERRAQLIAGWKQFAADLAEYVAPDVIKPVVAAPVEALPVVSVRMEGTIAVISNLDLFGQQLQRFVKDVPMQPSTDQEFADAEQACKVLQKAQDALEQAESAALAQTADIEAMRRTVADYTNLARTTRLTLERVVKARKEQIRQDIVTEAHTALGKHINALRARIQAPAGTISLPTDFGGAIKGKKTLTSMREAVHVVLTHAKLAANEIADRIEINVKSLVGDAHDWRFLFPDLWTVAGKSAEDFSNLAAARIATHTQREQERLEAERQRIRAEEEARARAAAAAEKIVAAVASAVVEVPVSSLGGTTIAKIAPPPAPARAPANEPRTLTLGQIKDDLGFDVSAQLLADLGFEFAPIRAAKCYRPSDFPLMCQRLKEHIDKRWAAWIETREVAA